jgi:hypothetical protein
MKDIEKIYFASGKPDKILRKALRKWFEILKSSDNYDKNDAPWFYNERASLSSFAGAIWLTGGNVLEEYCDKKSMMGSGCYKGRVDIWFNYGKKNAFIGEAKQRFCSLRQVGKEALLKKFDESISMAEKDIKKIKGMGAVKLAMLFVTPKVTKKENLDNQISACMKAAVEWTRKNDAIVACCFPKIKRKLKDPDSKHSPYFPGQMLLMKQVDERVRSR